MEHDRYQQNNRLFVIGLVCLLISLSLLAFGLYIIPFLLWSWRYNVPGFILVWHEWLKDYYDFSDSGASWILILVFIIPGTICGLISRWASNSIDKQILGLAHENEEKRQETRKEVQETLGFSLKIVLLIILVLVAVTIVEWIVAPPTA